jgi:hypothetical protein
MADMWKNRHPPTPLDFEVIMAGTFVQRVPNGTTGHGSTAFGSSTNGDSGQAILKDQRKLSLRDNLDLFISRSVNTLSFLVLPGFYHDSFRLVRTGLPGDHRTVKTPSPLTRTMMILSILLLHLPTCAQWLMELRKRQDGRSKVS